MLHRRPIACARYHFYAASKIGEIFIVSFRLCFTRTLLPTQRVTETIETLRDDEGARELKYALAGVGGDETCCLQIVADCACKSAEEMRLLANEAIFNCIKVCASMIIFIYTRVDIIAAIFGPLMVYY